MIVRKTIFVLAIMLLLPVTKGWADVEVGTLDALTTALSGEVKIIKLTADITVTSSIAIPNGFTIDGDGHTIKVTTPYLNEDGTVNGSPSSGAVFTIASGYEVVLRNMTVMGGSGTDDSFAAIMNEGKLTMENVTMTRCCRGLCNTGSSAVAVLQDCVLNRNAARFGGGLVNNAGQLVMDRCSFSENRSMNFGGGAAENKGGGKMYLNNVTMSNNASVETGSAINNFGTTYVMNSTITGNVTMGNATYPDLDCNYGAIAEKEGHVFVVNSIIIDNKYKNGDTLEESDTRGGNYYNCIIGFPNGGNRYQTYSYSLGSSIFKSYTDNGIYANYAGSDGITASFRHTTLIQSNGQYIAPLSSTGGDTSKFEGLITYFSYTPANEEAFEVKMSYLDGSINTSLDGLYVADYQVIINQDGSDRTPKVIGSSPVSSKNYYTVTRGAITNGTMTGVSMYGDSYPSGTLVTVTATANSGYWFSYWELNGNNVSTVSPYTFELTENTVVRPVFVDTPPISASATDYSGTYDGNPHTISVTVTDPTSGYSITYSYNGSAYSSTNPTFTNVGTYTVNYRVTATNYTTKDGTATVTITPKNIANGDITVIVDPATYHGAAQTPIVTVTDGTTGLVVNTDYTLSESSHTDAGTYPFTITGTGNYSGTRTVNFIISKRPITTTAITVTDLAYNASDQPTADQVTVAYNGTTIPAANYTVEPATVTEAGSYTLTITGKNNLTSFITKTLKVTKAMDGTYAADFNVSDIPTQIYKGAAVHPTVSVYDNGRLLTESIDYTVTYGDNNLEGSSTGTITISGAGVYSGSLNRTFGIVNEYFKEGDIAYRATSSTTVAVVDKDPNNSTTVTTTATGAVVIPATVEHIVADAFQVTGIETGAFMNRTDITGISMPHNTIYLSYIEDGAFEGCTALRYIDLCNAKDYTPTTLERDVEAAPFYGVPKQALVYLNSTAIAGENYVYKPGNSSDYLCDEFKIYDDVNGSQTGFAGSDYQWPFENLHNFKAKYIINTRTLVAGQHYTLCLPYDMTIPESFKVYQLVGANTANSLIGFKEVTDNRIEYQTPYVIIPTETGQLLNTTEEFVHEFKEERTDKTALNPLTGGDFKMYGTLRYMDGTDANGKYIMQSQNTWKQISSNSSTYTGACILPMRAYVVNTGSGARPYITATFTNSNGTTRVDQLRLDEDQNTTIYDLHGRRVSVSSSSVSSASSVFSVLPKGVYIINGKKVVK